MKILNSLNPFQRARITLTVSYCAILILILALFSVSLYLAQMQDIHEVIFRRIPGTRYAFFINSASSLEIRNQMDDLRKRLILNLLLVDTVILFFGGILSYILAGFTLRPIQKSIKRQKEFIADASHELRTPVTAIYTASEVALRGVNKSKQDFKKVVEQTFQESLRMKKLVEGLLDLSRADMDGEIINMTNVNLNEIITQSINQMEPISSQKGIHLASGVFEQTSILGNPDKIKQLLLILLDNALKYTPPGGKVTIDLLSKPKPKLSVSDTGIGISSSDKTRIFERFFRGDKSRSKTEGIGLGLSIANSIAQKHHTQIQVFSEIGQGSIFSVEFAN